MNITTIFEDSPGDYPVLKECPSFDIKNGWFSCCCYFIVVVVVIIGYGVDQAVRYFVDVLPRWLIIIIIIIIIYNNYYDYYYIRNL